MENLNKFSGEVTELKGEANKTDQISEFKNKKPLFAATIGIFLFLLCYTPPIIAIGFLVLILAISIGKKL